MAGALGERAPGCARPCLAGWAEPGEGARGRRAPLGSQGSGLRSIWANPGLGTKQLPFLLRPAGSSGSRLSQKAGEGPQPLWERPSVLPPWAPAASEGRGYPEGWGTEDCPSPEIAHPVTPLPRRPGTQAWAGRLMAPCRGSRRPRGRSTLRQQTRAGGPAPLPTCPSAASAGAAPAQSLTAVHAEVALGADGLDEAVRPAATGRGKAGAGAPALPGQGCPHSTRAGAPAGRAHSHAAVHALAVLLVLQPRLGQVDGEHAGDPDQPRDAAIDELGRQTVWGRERQHPRAPWPQGRGQGHGQGGALARAGPHSDLICLSAM